MNCFAGRSSSHPDLSYNRLILSASKVIAALTTAGCGFTTTIDRKSDTVPRRSAHFIFIALHDDHANASTPHTLVDIKITAGAADSAITVRDPAHIAKHQTIERFKRRLARHNFLFSMQVHL